MRLHIAPCVCGYQQVQSASDEDLLMRSPWWIPGITFAVGGCLVVLTNVASAGAQETSEPTDPVPTDTGVAAPSEVRYVVRSDGRFFTWRDNATDEDGYRLELTTGSESRNVETEANVTELRVPDDFSGACGGIRAAVKAFRGEDESEPAYGGLFGDCFSLATSTPGPVLPDSGNGPALRNSTSVPYVAVALLGIFSFAVLLISITLSSRTVRRDR